MNTRQFLLSAAIAAAAMLGNAAQASVVVYNVDLSGPNESPGNASPGSGSATVTFDPDLATMRVQLIFADLLGTTVAAAVPEPSTYALMAVGLLAMRAGTRRRRTA